MRQKHKQFCHKKSKDFFARLLATIKNSVVNFVFPIWPVVNFPKYLIEYQNAKIDSEIKILKVRKVTKTIIKAMQF